MKNCMCFTKPKSKKTTRPITSDSRRRRSIFHALFVRGFRRKSRMDSSHGKKRMNIEDDRLSSLPDDLIHKILSFVDIKHAIQTSALSSRWRFIWTSMLSLNFSRETSVGYSKFSEFVSHVLCNRNIQEGVHSVKLNFNGDHGFDFAKQILTSTLELPALTTLYLHDVCFRCYRKTDNCVAFFSKCANLKNLTLKRCKLYGTGDSSICLPLLSSLALDEIVEVNVEAFSIIAPRLKNLTIRDFVYEKLQCITISAPVLEFFLYKGNKCLPLSASDFLYLEKADICVIRPTDAHQVLRLLQQLHNVKSLTLNLEIVELLSSSVELMSRQSSPFANLKSLNIHPVTEVMEANEKDRVTMSTDVKRYLLDSSSGANFIMVSR